MCVCVSMCAVLLLLPLSNFLFVVVFALDDAALLQLVNIHSLCWQLNSDWNLALPRFAKMHFHCFSALFTIQMQKQQRFVYIPSHTDSQTQCHTHTQRVLFWRSIERARERERTQESVERVANTWFLFLAKHTGSKKKQQQEQHGSLTVSLRVLPLPPATSLCLVHSGARCSKS